MKLTETILAACASLVVGCTKGPVEPQKVEPEIVISAPKKHEYTPAKYPDGVRFNFVQACAPSYNVEFCSCVVDRIAQKVTLREFHEEEQIIARTGNPTSKFRQIAELSYVACESQ